MTAAYYYRIQSVLHLRWHCRRSTHIDDDFVNKLQSVARKHDGDNPPVDLSSQSLEINCLIGLALVIDVEIRLVEVFALSAGLDNRRIGRLSIDAGGLVACDRHLFLIYGRRLHRDVIAKRANGTTARLQNSDAGERYLLFLRRSE